MDENVKGVKAKGPTKRRHLLISPCHRTVDKLASIQLISTAARGGVLEKVFG